MTVLRDNQWTDRWVAGVIVLVMSLAAQAADDWPARMHDVQRSGFSDAPLSIPLVENWQVATPQPTPAWTEAPAMHDYAHKYYNLRPRQNFDRCSDVAVAGALVYFGSSSDGTMTCIDNANGGREVWRYCTEGPVRFAPQVSNGNVYFGSDDGWVYCLNASDGTLVWRERAGPTDEMIWGNEHMISVWPVRTSVLVDNGLIYWGAGIFPEEGMYLCCRNAADGTGGWTVTPQLASQGYLLATADRLFVPTGKTVPRIYSRANGELVGTVSGGRHGGSWAIIAPDTKQFSFGPGVRGEILQHNPATGSSIATIGRGNYLVSDTDHIYYSTDSEIVKIRRSNRKEVWKKKHAYPYGLIIADGKLFAAGDGEVAAFGIGGDEIWTGKVDGKVYGLAAADGCLFVSTDAGKIYSFRQQAYARAESAASVTETSAALEGHLVSAGTNAVSKVYVTWGLTDGGADRSKWDHFGKVGPKKQGPIACAVSNLKPDSVYYYRFWASDVADADVCSDNSSVLMTGHLTINTHDKFITERNGETATFTITRPGSASSDSLQVRYSVSGTASATEDFVRVSGWATIPAGERLAKITIASVDTGKLSEPDETIVVTLSPGPYLTGKDASATVTLRAYSTVDFDSWASHAKIQFSGYDPPTKGIPLTDFPALLLLNESLPGFKYSQFSAPGHGLRFTDPDRSQWLNYEIESWNRSGNSYVWVQVPELKDSSSSIEAHWSNPSAVDSPECAVRGAAWSKPYWLVWHFASQDKNVLVDATTNGRAGSVRNVGADTGTQGLIGNALGLDGENDYVHRKESQPDTEVSQSMWIKTSVDGRTICVQTEGGITTHRRDRSLYLENGNLFSNIYKRRNIARSSGLNLADGKWHHVVRQFGKSIGGTELYVDGERVGRQSKTESNFPEDKDTVLGTDGSSYYKGLIDEFRVETTTRPCAWIWACWKNQFDPAAFVTVTP